MGVSLLKIMNKTTAKIAIFTLILSVIIFSPRFILGQTDYTNDEENAEVKELNQQISGKREELKKLQEKQKAYTEAIRQKQEEKASLENQLSILDNRMVKAELDIDGAQIEIERTNLEIQKTDGEITSNNKEIAKEKEQIETALKLIDKEDQTNTLEIFLLHNSLTDFLNQVKYLEDINKEMGKSLDSLKEQEENLRKNREFLDQKNKELAKLKEEFENKKLALQSEKENKNFILEQALSSEKEYQRLLARARQEQQQASIDIKNAEQEVRERISKISKKELEFNDAGLIWPVPRNIITAYFHDPDYPFRYIFEHPAVDIRAGQGTPIRAAASGYVARARDAGRGYSYIMIIHGNEISTVYGHVSKIYVKEDEYVIQGQTIGLSGGLPGTPGAGGLTTGPHLHFEVRSGGIPVNPLEYLP